MRDVDKTTAMIVGGAAGLVFGLAVAAVGMALTARALRKGGNRNLTTALLVRMLLDLATLAAVFLVREFLPLPFAAVLIGTATGLALGSILSALLLGRRTGKRSGRKPEERE